MNGDILPQPQKMRANDPFYRFLIVGYTCDEKAHYLHMNAPSDRVFGRPPYPLDINTSYVSLISLLPPLDVHVHPIQSGIDEHVEGLLRHISVGDEATIKAPFPGQGEKIEAEFEAKGRLVEGYAYPLIPSIERGSKNHLGGPCITPFPSYPR
jgi:hypothetical protein